MKKKIVLVLSSKPDFYAWCESLLSEFEVLPASSLKTEDFSALALIVDYGSYDYVILSAIYTYFQEKRQIRLIFIGSDFALSAGERKSRFTKAKFFTADQYLQILRSVQAESLLSENLPYNTFVDDKFAEWNLTRGTEPNLELGDGDDSRKQMEELNRLLTVASNSDANVLLLGETGVGKSSAARKIHDLSSRRGGKFIEINIPNHIGRLESDLFGTVRGAFTEATNSDGLLKNAGEGTVFFDEIGDLPLEEQSKMLSLIETRCFRKMGSGVLERFNARMIFATNRDLRTLVKNHLFREDLFYRINTIVIEVPPLKNHRLDIPLMAKNFASGWNKMVSKSAILKLCSYSWPGNIRELKNCMERSCLLCPNRILEEKDILL